jgi:transcriptional regulator with XRE-family HTH domain
MTPAELRAARKALGLSVVQMAAMLGVTPIQIRRMETAAGKASARPIMPTTERLMRAYLAGYRPADWGEAGDLRDDINKSAATARRKERRHGPGEKTATPLVAGRRSAKWP